MAATTAVRVALRVRPLTEKERMCNCTECISFIPNQPQILVGKDHSFTYDYVFDTRTHQREVYETCVRPLVEKFIDGFNATILAYGQTGSGKTYSMGTAIDGNLDNPDHQGIVPRFIQDLYHRVDQKKTASANYDYQVLVSFLELYNEDLVDLLNMQQYNNHQRRRTQSGGSICEISIREDVHGNIYWAGVREEPCSNPNELLGFLAKGSLCRATGSTDMNSVSSRSHAIFSVILKQHIPDEDEPAAAARKTIVSKFHFVDLAGSERLKRTNAQGERAREGIAINSGLLALGNVISALGDESRRSTHIPYRDSKLTRLLQDSLGGNSQTLMLACVSPSDSNFVETLSTLKYANRARNIKNRVSINQEFAGSSVEVNQLRAQVTKLKMELQALRAAQGPSTINNAMITSNGNELNALREEVNRLRARVQEVSDELCQVKTQRDTLIMEREFSHVPSEDLPRLLKELMQQQSESQEKPSLSSSTSSTELPPQAVGMIAHYQKTIQNLRNELADTQERLAFVESTQAPMMHALAMASDITPTPSFSVSKSSRRRARGNNGRRRRVHASSSSSTRGFRSSRASKVPGSTKRRSEPADDAPLPPQPVAQTDNQDIEQWLQETIGFLGPSDNLRSEVRDSIYKARAEIEKGLKVLEDIKDVHHIPNHEGHTDCDIMADDELLVTMQVKENAFIFNELEHETFEDLEHTSPPPDWSADERLGRSRVASSGGDSAVSLDDSEITAMFQENPQLARMIQQVQSDIRVKEELVMQLEKCEAEYNQLRKKFEQRLSALHQEILAIKRERDLAVRRASYGQMSRNDTLAQREKQQLLDMRHAYEMKTKSLFAQLSELRRKYAQTTSAIQQSRNQNESMLRALRANVEALKMEKKRMIKRMKQEAERVKEQISAHEREIQKLRRKQLRDTETRRRLERENKQVQILLQKRTDEVILTNDKLKKLIHILKKAVIEGGVLDDRLLNKCANLLHLDMAPSASSARIQKRRARNKAAAKIPVEVRAAKKKHLLDRALYQYIEGKQAMMEMQQLIRKRNELSQKKEELLSEREYLFGGQGGQALMHFDQAMQQNMDERIETITAEISYLNARIHALHNDAAHEMLEDEEEVVVVDMDQQERQRPAKHVTFADEVMGIDKAESVDEWLDMDALEERYTLPPNADPETAHDMIMKLLKSLAPDEAEKVMEAIVNDVAALRMDEYSRQVHVQQLEKTIQDLQRTLTVMRDKAIETAIENEKKIKRLQQGSRRSSLSSFCVSEEITDDDSAIDVRVEEHYQQFGTIFDKIYNEGIHAIHSPFLLSRPGSPTEPQQSMIKDDTAPRSPVVGPSPTLPPVRPSPPVEKPSAIAARRNSMSSPEQFLQELMQAGLVMPGSKELIASSPRMKPADFTRYQADRESSTSSSHSHQQQQQQPLRRSSIQSDASSHGSGPTGHKQMADLFSSPHIINRRRAYSLQQQQPNIISKSPVPNRRRFSDHHHHHIAHQPSPLQQAFVVAGDERRRPESRRNSHNVFDRLSSVHTKASQAKRTSTPIPM